MYTLTDTFNNREISRHRTIAAAVKARAKHARSLKHHSGDTSYVTYSITSWDGVDITRMIEQAESDIYHSHP
jgi:hypothetical protein